MSKPMRHLEKINKLLDSLKKSKKIHALVLQSSPGWAKSSTVEQALQEMKVRFVGVGSYTTPLHLYNVLCEHPQEWVVLDDCAGLFSDAKAMSILKAATWSNAGTMKERKIAWGSTSDRALQESSIFSGKVVLLTNSIPETREAQAFLSRTFYYRFTFTKSQVQEMLLEGAQSQEHFPDTDLAKQVATWLARRMDEVGNLDIARINLRTLAVGYELAHTQPESWEELLESVAFASLNSLPALASTGPAKSQILKGASALLESPRAIVTRLSSQSLSIAAQLNEFQRLTGLSRRTFFLYRKEMGLGTRGK